MNRLPLECDVLWYQSKPQIDFTVANSKRGTVSFRADSKGEESEQIAELLKKLATGYAHALVLIDRLERENKNLRRSL